MLIPGMTICLDYKLSNMFIINTKYVLLICPGVVLAGGQDQDLYLSSPPTSSTTYRPGEGGGIELNWASETQQSAAAATPCLVSPTTTTSPANTYN